MFEADRLETLRLTPKNDDVAINADSETFVQRFAERYWHPDRITQYTRKPVPPRRLLCAPTAARYRQQSRQLTLRLWPSWIAIAQPPSRGEPILAGSERAGRAFPSFPILCEPPAPIIHVDAIPAARSHKDNFEAVGRVRHFFNRRQPSPGLCSAHLRAGPDLQSKPLFVGVQRAHRGRAGRFSHGGGRGRSIETV